MSQLISNDEVVRVRVRENFHEAGRTGRLLAIVDVNDYEWAVVLWDGEDDPDCFKAKGLEKAVDAWEPL